MSKMSSHPGPKLSGPGEFAVGLGILSLNADGDGCITLIAELDVGDSVVWVESFELLDQRIEERPFRRLNKYAVINLGVFQNLISVTQF